MPNGRPYTKKPRNKFLKFRVNDTEIQMLKRLEEVTGMTKTALMVRGLKMQYNLAKYKVETFALLPEEGKRLDIADEEIE